MIGPKAPKDPESRGKSFYIMRNQQVAGSPMPDGTGVHTIFLNNDRLVSFAKIVGNIRDSEMLELLRSASGFRRLVSAIGVSVEGESLRESVTFCLQMYGETEGMPGTCHCVTLSADAMEHVIKLSEIQWKALDAVLGQLRFEFEQADRLATVSVRLYLKEGFDAPEPEEETEIDFGSPQYQAMLEKSLLQTGNNLRLKRVLEKARRGADVKIAFLGGSITQGAWALPINTACYAYRAFEGFCALAGRGTEENLHYVKAGVGGTSSELGMVRYQKEICGEEDVPPDLCVVEFAVNDEGDETKGESYDCLVRRILLEENAPAVVLLFSVFSNDMNLQERLRKVGEAYNLPMVSIKDCVVEQFYRKPEEGRVISKSQFFYDIFHPNSNGHRVMADCLLHLFRTVDGQLPDEPEREICRIKPPYGDEFAALRYVDRDCPVGDIFIDCGDFSERDENLQMVERDRNTRRTPEFEGNWMHRTGKRPFVMDITCTALLIVEKDSGSPLVGSAEVFVDGERVRIIDPHEVGWVHCNALICFRGRERKRHHVEIAMRQGDEEKQFTILGFAYADRESAGQPSRRACGIRE